MADSALSRDHKLHRRHKQRLQKMLDVSEEAAYQLVESGSPTILGTAPMLVPTRAMVLALVDCAKLAGCTGFTSIGSGGSALECLLSYYFSGNVVAVDVAAEVFSKFAECLHAQQQLKRVVLHASWEIADVVQDHALLFVWGSRAPWEKYVADYRDSGGKLIIVVGEAGRAWPPKSDNEETLQNLLPGWEQVNQNYGEQENCSRDVIIFKK